MNDSLSSFSCLRERKLCRGELNTLDGHYAVNIALNVLLALAAILGNGLVFAAHYYSPSIHKPVNTMLVSLAATDFLNGAMTQLLYIWEKTLMVKGNCTRTVCIVTDLKKFFLLLMLGETVLNLSVITLDRYIAIFHTYRYPELVTNSWVKKLLGIIWISWVIISVLASVFGRVTTYIGAILIINVVFILAMYVKLYLEIRRMDTSVVLPTTGQNAPRAEEQRRATERKTAKSVGIILGSLFLSYLPFILFTMFSFFGIGRLSLRQKEIFRMYAGTAALSNSATNVLIYYWRNEEMRKAMRDVLREVKNAFGNEN